MNIWYFILNQKVSGITSQYTQLKLSFSSNYLLFHSFWIVGKSSTLEIQYYLMSDDACLYVNRTDFKICITNTKFHRMNFFSPHLMFKNYRKNINIGELSLLDNVWKNVWNNKKYSLKCHYSLNVLDALTFKLNLSQGILFCRNISYLLWILRSEWIENWPKWSNQKLRPFKDLFLDFYIREMIVK